MPFFIPYVFISSTSSDLGEYRKAASDSLLNRRHGRRQPIIPVDQEKFSADYRGVIDFIYPEISKSAAVISLIGFNYGGEPEQEGGRPRRSYTQIEYDIARKLNKPIFHFFATPNCERLPSINPIIKDYIEFHIKHDKCSPACSLVKAKSRYGDLDDESKLQVDHYLTLYKNKRRNAPMWKTFSSIKDLQLEISKINFPLPIRVASALFIMSSLGFSAMPAQKIDTIDYVAPSIDSWSPDSEDSTHPLSVKTVIRAKFSEKIDKGTIKFTLKNLDDRSTIPTSCDYTDNEATWRPKGLLPGHRYRAELSSVEDFSKNPIETSPSWDFKTALAGSVNHLGEAIEDLKMMSKIELDEKYMNKEFIWKGIIQYKTSDTIYLRALDSSSTSPQAEFRFDSRYRVKQEKNSIVKISGVVRDIKQHPDEAKRNDLTNLFRLNCSSIVEDEE